MSFRMEPIIARRAAAVKKDSLPDMQLSESTKLLASRFSDVLWRGISYS
jgi:hypothetical protein